MFKNLRDPRTRFTDRVEDYVRWRPSYPPEVIALVAQRCAAEDTWTIADIGAGTGISSQLLLKLGCNVIAVEPNENMLRAAEALLQSYPRFSCVPASAEETSLPDQSVDLIACFQAFHWFNNQQTAREFRRILRNQKWVLLVWNTRKKEESEFSRAYESLLNGIPDYRATDHSNIRLEEIAEFVGNELVEKFTFSNSQQFDWIGLRGRFLSSSWAPNIGTPEHEPTIAHLHRLFDLLQVGGNVEFQYVTEMYLGRMI